MEPSQTGFLGVLRGVVETLEQKSGLNALLYLDAIFGLPCLILYGITEKSIFLAFVWILLVFTLLIYGLAFLIDRNFLRSEKHVRDMKQLDLLGDNTKQLTPGEAAELEPIDNPKLKKTISGGNGH